jgi:hypothetical protein
MPEGDHQEREPESAPPSAPDAPLDDFEARLRAATEPLGYVAPREELPEESPAGQASEWSPSTATWEELHDDPWAAQAVADKVAPPQEREPFIYEAPVAAATEAEAPATEPGDGASPGPDALTESTPPAGIDAAKEPDARSAESELAVADATTPEPELAVADATTPEPEMATPGDAATSELQLASAPDAATSEPELAAPGDATAPSAAGPEAEADTSPAADGAPTTPPAPSLPPAPPSLLRRQRRSSSEGPGVFERVAARAAEPGAGLVHRPGESPADVATQGSAGSSSSAEERGDLWHLVSDKVDAREAVTPATADRITMVLTFIAVIVIVVLVLGFLYVFTGIFR